MTNKMFYKGKYVAVASTFMFRGESLSSINVGEGLFKTVPTADLEHINNHVEDNNNNNDDIEDNIVKEVESEQNDGVIEENVDENTPVAVSEEVVDKDTDDTVEANTEQLNEDNDKSVVAINVSDDSEVNIGDIDSKSFSDFVDSKKMDINAVLRVLNGEQKTHKGYTFKQA